VIAVVVAVALLGGAVGYAAYRRRAREPEATR
jgi:hypothetical protein